MSGLLGDILEFINDNIIYIMAFVLFGFIISLIYILKGLT